MSERDLSDMGTITDGDRREAWLRSMRAEADKVAVRYLRDQASTARTAQRQATVDGDLLGALEQSIIAAKAENELARIERAAKGPTV